ncbi:histidine ammonia-lyase [Vibrio sp. SCSIO 43137]|uniref:histidine ammonia-lyase n=1 Tax=Vibrio sp. SCSIO 43137 TaxID=3021011 RepID=UPI00230704B3|nr:histidine ammonia-lyase [Vibrio sp. SCSIO 43137]WCE29684.1 histidine ammonia-lyase [Vibrio sp. SCSIO 43137]
MKKNYLLFSAAVVVAGSLAGCGEESNSGSSAPTKVDVYTSIDNCSTAVDVPNCQFENGIYVLKIDTAVSDAQQARTKVQVEDFISRLHDDVRKRYSQKRVVIGLLEDEPDPSSGSTADAFVLKLADSMNENSGTPKVLDAVELVYTNLGGKDETTSLTTYQKLIQLFDYYIDGNNNTIVGAELLASYNAFKALLIIQASGGYPEYLVHDSCNYGNGQLNANTCTTDPDDDPDGKGKRDQIHTLSADLNPGAMIGLTYEYMRDPSKAELGEVKGSSGTVFSNTGTIGQGSPDAINWSNPAFKPLADYINKWLLTK